MKISVAMTTYNGARYLRDQLDSISRQTRIPDEIIVCDDGSIDSTVQLLCEHAARAPFPVKVVVNEERLGTTRNFEQAIRLCSGDLIALSDQDDVWHPQKLEIIEQRFDSDSALGLVFTNGDVINLNGSQLRRSLWSLFRFDRRLHDMLRSSREAYDLLLSRFFITGATIVFRSIFRDVCLPIPDGLPTFIHDRWIAVTTAGVARIEGIDERLIAYRLHPKQQMGVGRNPIRMWFAPYCCSSDLAALRMIRERLPAKAANPDFLAALGARQHHLSVRLALSGNVISRLKYVAREYFSGSYRKYPLGRAYAFKDLLVGTR